MWISVIFSNSQLFYWFILLFFFIYLSSNCTFHLDFYYFFSTTTLMLELLYIYFKVYHWTVYLQLLWFFIIYIFRTTNFPFRTSFTLSHRFRYGFCFYLILGYCFLHFSINHSIVYCPISMSLYIFSSFSFCRFLTLFHHCHMEYRILFPFSKLVEMCFVSCDLFQRRFLGVLRRMCIL